MPLLDHVEQVLLGKSHWNVFNHDGSQCLNTVQNGMEVDRIVCQFRDFVHLTRCRHLRLHLTRWLGGPVSMASRHHSCLHLLALNIGCEYGNVRGLIWVKIHALPLLLHFFHILCVGQITGHLIRSEVEFSHLLG